LQLRLIRWAKGVGFTLREIRELLQVVGEHAREPSDRVRSRFDGKLKVDERMRQLASIREELRALGGLPLPGRMPDHRARGQYAVHAAETKEITMMLGPLLPFVLAAGVAATEKPADPAIACRANALDKTQRKRQQELLALVRRSAQVTRDLPDGFAIRLPSDATLFQQAAEWVGLERRRCPFVRFSLQWNQDDSVWIELTGAPGVKEVLEAEILGPDRSSEPRR
jgi:DNA-binding transcriptional MerR regulator